jgi:hypothetical protein
MRRAAAQFITAPIAPPPGPATELFKKPEAWALALIAGAEEQIGQTLSYDPAYVQISYPQGDVPLRAGVCTDVIIRAYRKGLAFDLQKAVHEDMRKNFSQYPRLWNLKQPDRNIDHRRVPNLATYFRRQGASLPVSTDASAYEPGDVVTQLLPGGRPHVVLVTQRASGDSQRPLCVHNIGAGARLDDCLFAFEVTGHFRFKGMA